MAEFVLNIAAFGDTSSNDLLNSMATNANISSPTEYSKAVVPSGNLQYDEKSLGMKVLYPQEWKASTFDSGVLVSPQRRVILACILPLLMCPEELCAVIS